VITGFPGLSRGRGEILQKVSGVYSGNKGRGSIAAKGFYRAIPANGGEEK